MWYFKPLILWRYFTVAVETNTVIYLTCQTAYISVIMAYMCAITYRSSSSCLTNIGWVIPACSISILTMNISSWILTKWFRKSLLYLSSILSHVNRILILYFWAQSRCLIELQIFLKKEWLTHCCKAIFICLFAYFLSWANNPTSQL